MTVVKLEKENSIICHSERSEESRMILDK